MTNEIAIQCRGIKKSYGAGESRIEALKEINLDIYHNELTLLVGPSGSGKSTLLAIITLILTADSGQLVLLDRDVKNMSEKEKALFRCHDLGVVFQSLFLIPSLTVAENVALPLLVAGQNHDLAEKKAIEMLKQVHMDQRSHTSPAYLSKGQQQRVAIARAIANNSEILICDEPTSALDQTAGLEVMSILQNLAKHASKTVLVVTHDHRVFPFADRIIHINDGQIVPGENL